MAFLIQIKDGVPQPEFTLPAEPITMGRQADNAIVLKDSRVSRKHARIEVTPEGVRLTDLESTHLTYLNEEPVSSEVLRHGDRISVAQIFDFFFFEQPDEELLNRLLAGGSAGGDDDDAYSAHLTQEMGNLMSSLRGDSLMDSQAAGKLQNKVKQVVQELKSLYEITNAISAETDLNRVLELVVVHVIKATKAERGFVMLLVDGELKPVMARDQRGNLSEEESKQFSSTLAGKAVETQQTFVSKDTSADPEMATKSVVDYNIRSCICSPLQVKGKVIGCLYVDAKESIRSFTERDVDFFQALSGQAAIAIENARLLTRVTSSNRALKRKVSELEAMFMVSQSLSFGQGQEEVLATILDQSIKVIGSARGSIMLLDSNTETLKVSISRGELNPEIQDRIELASGEGIAGWVLERGEGYIGRAGANDPNFARKSEREGDIQQILCVPLKGSEGAIGVISLVNKQHGEFSKDDLQLLANLAHHAAVSIEKARLYNLAVFDGLTKIYVVRYLNAWLEKEISKGLRHGNELSILYMDVDHFKKFNDTYGHQIGDQVLVELAQIMREQARESDLVARYGGEEFCIALPETDMPGAEVFAERLRARVENHRIKTPNQELRVTISIGICNLATSGCRNRDELIKAADKCLYQAKARGRNQWVAYKPSLSSRELADQVKAKITSSIGAVSGVKPE